jgi:hypothetical protein
LAWLRSPAGDSKDPPRGLASIVLVVAVAVGLPPCAHLVLQLVRARDTQTTPAVSHAELSYHFRYAANPMPWSFIAVVATRAISMAPGWAKWVWSSQKNTPTLLVVDV